MAAAALKAALLNCAWRCVDGRASEAVHGSGGSSRGSGSGSASKQPAAAADLALRATRRRLGLPRPHALLSNQQPAQPATSKQT